MKCSLLSCHHSQFQSPYQKCFFIFTGVYKHGQLDFPDGSDSKESTCNAGGLGLIPGLGRLPGGRHWLPTPVFLPGDPHGQRSLVGHSPWGCKESDMTERLTPPWLTILHIPFCEYSLHMYFDCFAAKMIKAKTY